MTDIHNYSNDIVLSEYRVVSILANSFMHSIYLGRNLRQPGKIVVIKIFHTSNPRTEEQFTRSIRLLKMLRHPHILPLLDAGLHNGEPYLITNYCSQGSLRERLREREAAPLPLKGSLALLTQIGEALAYAHQFNCIHNNLKPENILFSAAGQPLLADFNWGLPEVIPQLPDLSRATCMAPEQFKGLPDKASDQYGLACLAYRLFTGRPPFSNEDIAALTLQHLQEQPVSPTQLNLLLPPRFEGVLLKALAKQIGDRYPSINVFLEELTAAASAQTRPASLPHADAPAAPASQEPLAPPRSPSLPHRDALARRSHPQQEGTTVDNTLAAAFVKPSQSRVSKPEPPPASRIHTKPEAIEKVRIRKEQANAPMASEGLHAAETMFTPRIIDILPVRGGIAPGTGAAATPPTRPGVPWRSRSSGYEPRRRDILVLFAALGLLVMLGGLIVFTAPRFLVQQKHLVAGMASPVTRNMPATLPTATPTVAVTPSPPVPTRTAQPAPVVPPPVQPTATAIPTRVPTPPPTPTATPGPTFSVNPSQLYGPRDCQPSGSNYKCMLMLSLSYSAPAPVRWSAQASGLNASFNPPANIIYPGQRQSVFMTVNSTCPGSGVFLFNTQDGTLTVGWSC